MIKKLRFLGGWLLFFMLGPMTVFAQTQFWSDNFEDTGSPSVGSRTLSIAEFMCPGNGFFKRTDNSDITWKNPGDGTGAFTGFNGSKYFGAMDIDRGPTCGGNNTISAAQTITWTGINISGKTGLSFKGLFGANSAAVFQGIFFNTESNNYALDYMVVEYRIDNGSWTKVIGIYPNDGTANGGKMAQDTDGNMIGDGTALGNTMSEIVGSIAGTGSLLDLRFSIFVNNNYPGAMAFDNFRLFHTTTLPVSISGFKVEKENGQVVLNWTTTSEQNNKAFAIYRSGDDKNFVKIGEIAGNGTSATANTYMFADRKPLNGNNYYKLVQMDMDGKEHELDTKSVDFVLNAKSVSLYPNPASNKITLTFASDRFSSAKLIGHNGKVLKSLVLGRGDAEATIDISALAKGIYFIELNGQHGKVVEKLIKK